MTEIINELKQVKHEGIFGATIRDNAEKAPKEAIKMILDQLKDNRVLTMEIVGKRLVTLIESL